MTSFKLNTGRTVRLEMYHLYPTNGGSLEGSPAREESIQIAKERAARLWGEGRPTVLIEPPPGPLPEYTACLWLDSEAIADGYGSHLCLITFVSAGRAMQQAPLYLAEALLRELSWEEHAEDWDP
jgi:hypothetical protein